MKNEFKHLLHLDEKVLKPKDVTRSGAMISSKATGLANNFGAPNLRPDGLMKSLIGKPRVYDMKGNLLAEEENLVVLRGREYLAQLIAGTPPTPSSDDGCGKLPISDTPIACDYTNYRITHFAVGDDGTDGGCPPVADGPYDNDTNLRNPKGLFPQEGAVIPGDYLNMGGSYDNNTLKKIDFSDGSITVISEEHTINDGVNGELPVKAYTAVRYIMYIMPGETTGGPTSPNNTAFRFNEAGLYGIKYNADGSVFVNTDGSCDYLLFARFTTLDKYLEDSDGIMIEWYILV
jgi:hypothetical protein